MKYAYLIITIFFILCFDLWVEKSDFADEFYSNYLSPIFDEGKVSIICLFGTVPFLIVLYGL